MANRSGNRNAKTNRHNKTRRTFSSVQDDSSPVENPLDGVTFTLDGKQFRCHGEISLLDYSELAAMAMQGADITSPAGIAMISSFISLALGGVEYLRLKHHVREHKTPPSVLFDMVTEISDALQDFAEQETGRPTQPSSPSPDGLGDRDERIAKIVSLGTGEVRVVDESEIPQTG